MSGARRAANRATQETFLVRLVLTTTVLAFFTIFILLPLIVVFSEALSEGVRTYFSALADPDARHAILLTLIVVSIVVPLNTVFGLAAAWAIARFDFRGRALLTSLIDLPLWVSPVISGLVYVLVFGKRGWLGPWCSDHNIVVIFALPGMGRLAADSIFFRDFPMLQGVVLIMAFTVLLFNLVTDLFYAYLDPRIRLE